jgi:hypothetical protein
MASRKDKHDGDARSTSRITRDPFPKKPPYWKELWGVDITPDEWKAFVFLAGYDRWVGTGVSQTRLIGLVPPPGGKPSYVRRKREIGFVKVSYLSGENEALGREALIRVLKKPLKRPLQVALIGLFAQDEYSRQRHANWCLGFARNMRAKLPKIAPSQISSSRELKKPRRMRRRCSNRISRTRRAFLGARKRQYTRRWRATKNGIHNFISQ